MGNIDPNEAIQAEIEKVLPGFQKALTQVLQGEHLISTDQVLTLQVNYQIVPLVSLEKNADVVPANPAEAIEVRGLALPCRARKVLSKILRPNEGYGLDGVTLGDIRKIRPEEIRSYKNVGDVTLGMIHKILLDHGLTPKHHGWPEPIEMVTGKQRQFYASKEELTSEDWEKLRSAEWKCPDSKLVVDYFFKRNNQPSSIGDVNKFARRVDFRASLYQIEVDFQRVGQSYRLTRPLSLRSSSWGDYYTDRKICIVKGEVR